MRTFILTCIALLLMGNVNAQSAADLELAEMLNSGDMLRLNDRYPQMKDSLQVPMLARLAEANLYVSFNQLEKAEEAMADLFAHHQQELDAQTQIGMAALRAMNFLNLGQYAAGGEMGEDLVSALEQQIPFEQLYSFVFIERIGKALAHSPAPFLSRPAATQQVPMRIDSVGRGHHLMIPVQVNGITKDFIFDTGCSFGNFVSEAYAKEAGLEIVSDSIPVSGTQIGYVKLGVADSLCVGDMVYHHPVFLIAPPNAETDSVFSFDGVLGYHFIRDAKEIILDFEHDCFIFPEQPSEAEPNMYLSSNTPPNTHLLPAAAHRYHHGQWQCKKRPRRMVQRAFPGGDSAGCPRAPVEKRRIRRHRILHGLCIAGNHLPIRCNAFHASPSGGRQRCGKPAGCRLVGCRLSASLQAGND